MACLFALYVVKSIYQERWDGIKTMENMLKINENIYRLTIPFKDIFTTVYVLKTDEGALLFDTATYDEDIQNYIIPFLDELEITEDMLKYVFISHTDREKYVFDLKERIEKELKPKKVFVTQAFAASGTNIGPGMIGVYYMGDSISADLEKEKEAMNRVLTVK